MKALLLLLCRYPYDEKNRDELAALMADVSDWNGLVTLINAHGITALAAYNLKESGLDKMIPDDAKAFLEKGYLQSVVRNSWLTERWKEVNSILSDAGISHILLKGMALEHTLYGSLGLRQMNDNDILIRREDALRAWSLLKEKGFESKALKSPLHRKILPDLGKHLPELYKAGYSLEIHTRLFDETIPDPDFYKSIFDKAVAITVNNIIAYVLPDDINIRFLVKHFTYHRLSGDCQLRLYNDIRLLDRDNPPEFPESFIYEPIQKSKPGFRKESYITSYKAIPNKYRLRFLAGDIFPSLDWMRERYRCSAMGAVMRYPGRLGKVWWVVGAGCWVLGAGCWLLGTGCWVAGCWVLVKGLGEGEI